MEAILPLISKSFLQFFIQEGPFSKLNDDEFYDAVETALDREDEESELVWSAFLISF